MDTDHNQQEMQEIWKNSINRVTVQAALNPRRN